MAEKGPQIGPFYGMPLAVPRETPPVHPTDQEWYGLFSDIRGYLERIAIATENPPKRSTTQMLIEPNDEGRA